MSGAKVMQKEGKFAAFKGVANSAKSKQFRRSRTAGTLGLCDTNV